jgi:peptidoglycan/LPS O-acetylase OafA/YrhL
MTTNDSRKNSFDILRFLAAGMVVYSHSFALTGLPEPRIGGISYGGLGVWAFFAMSGYLIAGSWEQYPRFPVFIIKRILRIFPGLLLALTITVFAIGFYSSLSYREYIFKQETLTYFNNILLINTQYSLPGAFTGNIYPNAVNGSLWTLAFEFLMYLLVAVAGLARKLTRRWVWPFWISLAVLNLVAAYRPKYLTYSLFYLDARLVVQLGLLYFSGVLLYLHRDRVLYPFWAWIPALALFVLLSNRYPIYSWLFGATLLAYGILGASKITFFSQFGRFGDFSYGIYVYSFPVQQVIWHHTQTRSPIRMFALAMFVSLVFSIISWYAVEKPSINLKKRVSLDRYPLSQKSREGNPST